MGLKKRKFVLMISVGVLLLLMITGGIAAAFFGQQKGDTVKEVEKLFREIEKVKEENKMLKDELFYLEEELLDVNRQYGELQKELQKYREGHQREEESQEDEYREEKNHSGGSGPTAYLTFDDGPSKNTLQILDILKEHHIPATFFVTGNNVSGDDDIYNRILLEGHALGNHTYTHNFRTLYQSREDFLEDFLRLEHFLYEKTGLKTDIMRFPGGSSSQMAQDVSEYNIIVEDLIPKVKDLGYDYFDWNVSSGDGTADLFPEELVENVLQGAERLEEDIVVLFHDSSSRFTTVKALPEIIAGLSAKGYDFQPLSPGAAHVKHR